MTGEMYFLMVDFAYILIVPTYVNVSFMIILLYMLNYNIPDSIQCAKIARYFVIEIYSINNNVNNCSIIMHVPNQFAQYNVCLQVLIQTIPSSL